jgi:hypothetical protein
VAREIEGRTAGIAWTLSRSRARWLVQRILPLAVVAIVLAAAVGIGSEFVTRANPYAELAANPGFYDYTSRGMLLPMRAVVVLLLAVAVGAMLPRQLPALLLAIAVTAALFIGLTVGMDTWMTAEAQPIPIVDEATFGNGPRIFDVAYREDATGKVITMNDFYNQYGDVALPDGEENPPGFTQVAIGIPGDQYWTWAAREAAAYGALAVLGGGLAAVVVRRRRP